MRIIFRYDDFSAGAAVSLETDRMVFDLFLQYRLALLVGVTPRMSGAIHNLKNEVFHHLERDADRIALLRKGLEQGWQLALHGFNHQSTGSVQASEFAGQPREVQAAKIEEGLQILRPCFPGAALDVFIPPWDSFDGTTADCLADQGFRVICGTYTTRGFGHPKVSFVPSLFETRGLVDYLTHYSVEDLKRVAGDGWLVVTLHGYNFDGSRKGCFVSIPALSETLKKLQDSGVSVGVIPTGEKPSLLNARQESILKGKLLLCRRKLVRAFLPFSGPRGSEPALIQIGDGLALLAWKLRTHFKLAC